VEALVPRRVVVAIFIVALAVKLGFLLVVRDNPFVFGLTNDESFHVQEAQTILSDGPLRDDAFYFAPLYPYVLAALFLMFGERMTVALVFNSVLGAANVAVVALLAARVSGVRRTAWIAAGLTLLYGPYLMYETLVLKSTLAVIASNVSLWLVFLAIDRRSRGLWFGCGVSFGVLALLRGNSLLVLPFVLCGLVIEHRRHRVSAASIALWMVGVAAGILPATVHNAVVALDFVPTTYQGGSNFYIGNYRGATGTYQSLRPGRGHPVQERYDAVTLAEDAEGRSLWPSEVSSYWFRRGLSEIVADPAAWLRLTAKKLLMFHGDLEIMDTVDYRVYRELSPALWLAPLSFGMIAGLALPGLWVSRRLAAFPMLALVLIGSTASVVLFFVFGRYRLPVVTLYVLFAAMAGNRLIDGVRSRSWVPAAGITLTAAAAFGLLSIPVADANPGVAYNTAAGMFSRSGDLEHARRYFERAVATLPDQPELRHNLANTLMRQEDYCAAAEQYRIEGEIRDRLFAGDPDPIVKLQAFEGASALLEALSLCGTEPGELANERARRRRLAGAVLDEVSGQRLRVTDEMLVTLEQVVGDEDS